MRNLRTLLKQTLRTMCALIWPHYDAGSRRLPQLTFRSTAKIGEEHKRRWHTAPEGLCGRHSRHRCLPLRESHFRLRRKLLLTAEGSQVSDSPPDYLKLLWHGYYRIHVASKCRAFLLFGVVLNYESSVSRTTPHRRGKMSHHILLPLRISQRSFRPLAHKICLWYQISRFYGAPKL